MAHDPSPDEVETIGSRTRATAYPSAPPSSLMAPSTPSGGAPGSVNESAIGAGAVDRVRLVLTQGRVAVARIMVYAMGAATLAGFPVALAVPGTPLAKALAVGSLVVLVAIYAGVMRRAAMPHRGEVPRFLGPAGAMIGMLAGITLNYAFGLFAPLPFAAVIGFIILYLGVGASEGEALNLYLASATAYAVAIVLALVGVLPEIGLFSSGHVDRGTMWIALGGTELALGFAYVLAQTTGRYGRRLVARLDRAVREATRREALLREVRADLERAAGVGAAGLFTDLELGAFVLGDVIGRGGMGEVYAATDRRDGSEVAVKLLRRDVMASQDAVRRFEREARIAAELDSEHVVQVREVGGLDAPLPFIAMERLHGEDLAGLLRARGRLGADDVARLVVQTCAGLRAAHARGIVHRDLKPQNLFLQRASDGSRRWKILDFGVSKLLFGPDVSLAADHVVGTPTYMAPEQAMGSSDIDERADVYALCVVAYRALTGAPAFANGPAAVVLRAVTERMPEDPAQLATLPPDVGPVLRIGLAKAPADRFPDAGALAEAFEEAARGRLSERWRSHATALLERQGWGATVPPGRDEPTAP